MTHDPANDAFQALHDAQRQAQRLCMNLRDAGDDAGAADARLRADRLQNEIDHLLHKELDGWQKTARQSVPQLLAAARAARKAVDQANLNVNNAQKIVRALDALDQMISLAMKLVGTSGGVE